MSPLPESTLVAKGQENSERIAADCILRGGVCVLPTDTVYGFSGIVPASKDRIQKIKGRDDGKPFIQLIAEPRELFKFTDAFVPDQLFSLWPGPLTLVVPMAGRGRAGSTLAFRCPGDGWLRRVISLVGSPIYSTSVNRSGQPVLRNLAAICGEFLGEVDLIVDGDAMMPSEGLASTLVELIPEGGCRILRQGNVKIPESLLA